MDANSPTNAAAPTPRRRASGVTDLASLVLLLVAAAVLWWQPLRAYHCLPQGTGLARCVVADRLLGLVLLRERVIAGIAEASHGTEVARSQGRHGIAGAAEGPPREILTRVEALTLLDARQRVLWQASEQLLLGSSLAALASGIAALCSGEETAPLVRWYLPWPPLLLATLFSLIGASHLSVRLGLALIARRLLPRSLHHAVYWGPTLAMLALLAGVWLVALAGGDPPEWLGLIVAPAAPPS